MSSTLLGSTTAATTTTHATAKHQPLNMFPSLDNKPTTAHLMYPLASLLSSNPTSEGSSGPIINQVGTVADSSQSSVLSSRGLMLHSMMYGLNVYSEINQLTQ